MFGNVNVDYKPCKSVSQLRRACNYILGRNPEQIEKGVVKTSDNLYFAFDGNRDNFAEDVLLTRRLWKKSIDGKKNNLAYKMSISFHPDDNEKISYEEAFRIAGRFAEKYFHSKGFDVMFAVHTDTEHIHAHFIIGNCNRDTGKAFRRNQKDLYEMSEFFGSQCAELDLKNSVRNNFYSENPDRNKEKFNESQMTKKGAETFKAELREAIDIEIADTNNHTVEDVINSLLKHYRVECRLKGNTISYRHPDYKNKNGQLVSVRGSKLGEKYTVKGVQNELTKNRRNREQTADSLLFERTPESASKETSQQSAYDGSRVGADKYNTGGQMLTGTARGNEQHSLYAKSVSGGHESECGNSDIACDSREVRRDTSGLFDEYKQTVRKHEREADVSAEHSKRIRKKRKEVTR